MSALTQTHLRELLHYVPETGEFFWKVARGRYAKRGSRAGTLSGQGYIRISVHCRAYGAHRLAYLYEHGWMPKEVDHKNRVRTDNRIENLRPVTRSMNNANAPASVRSKTGYRGVHFHKGAGRYRAQITLGRKTKSLGYFDTPEEAYSAYCAAAHKVHQRPAFRSPSGSAPSFSFFAGLQ